LLASSYFFKACKLSNAADGDYIINFNKNVIEVNLKTVDGRSQKFMDKIKLVEKDKIISEKIKSTKGEKIYYQYFLDAKSKSVIKLEYKKEGEKDLEIFKLLGKKQSFCKDVKTNWNKRKIKETKKNKEDEAIQKAQEKMKIEQSKILNCQGNNPKKWTNCKGAYLADAGHKFIGQFIKGEIIKGTAIYLGGSKYIGDFKNFEPHGIGNFVWANGDKYFGEWKNGTSHGTGTKMWKDGREYSGTFKNDKLDGEGTFYYPDGKKYVGSFLDGKRHGQGTFTYLDGTTYVGRFISGKEQGIGKCFDIYGINIPCEQKIENKSKVQEYVGKDTRDIYIVAKKWVRISQYESNTKRGKKIMDKLKTDFDTKASELCSAKGNYKILRKNIEVLDLDETPAYGLETKLKLGINGVVECI
tara:strand:+ start:1860 stop:3098 length:1239 start_codon:yes stop_codon:yes gene_type:complete